MNAADLLDRAARYFPSQPALVFEGRSLSYADLRMSVQRVAAGLLEAGVQPGDRVALFLPNIPEFIVAYQACQWAGAITVSANVMLTTDELRYLLEDSGAKLVFTTESLWQPLAPLVASVLGGPERVVVCEGAVAGTRALAEFGRETAGQPPLRRERSDAAAILYTSGTTGRQKGATLSVGNIVSNAHTIRHLLRITAEDRLLLFLPLFHVFGQNFIMASAIASGAAIVLHRRFDPDAVLTSIARDRVSMFFAVPAIYIMLLGDGIRAERMHGVRYFFSAAATMPVEVATRWTEIFGIPIHEGYGLTETSPFASYNHEWRHRPGSIGTPIDNVDMRVVDAEDRDVPAGTWGEICIKGPNIMLGYWNRPAETAEALRGGWFHSGDVGYVDDDGYFFIVDRTKDMINSAGFKIWPREVEEVLYQHAAVGECAVFGARDAVKGEVAMAAVVLAPGVSATSDELEAFCRERLATYKVPRAFQFVSALPKSATGKVLKRVLRDQVPSA
jgi:long-chain acyl-CoA synthetase